MREGESVPSEEYDETAVEDDDEEEKFSDLRPRLHFLHFLTATLTSSAAADVCGISVTGDGSSCSTTDGDGCSVNGEKPI